jgi:hypothetical protein
VFVGRQARTVDRQAVGGVPVTRTTFLMQRVMLCVPKTLNPTIVVMKPAKDGA